MTWMNQLIVAPILLPLLTAALMLMLTALGHQSVRAHKPSNQAKVVAATEGAA